ncbi:MAG: hypothetical protein Q4E10_04120 [Porphyromonas sp.]|nr:hypothetical protein [Porphyromonas sp.]
MGNFNEATRVQMPEMLHLARIGYKFFGKIHEHGAGSVYDPDTNILLGVFEEQFAESHRLEAEVMKQLDTLQFNPNIGADE